jgi:hypothetical protein
MGERNNTALPRRRCVAKQARMASMRMRRVVRPVLLWCAFMTLPTYLFVKREIRAVRALRNPVVIAGTVVELRPEVHQSVVIRYNLGGTTYETSTVQPEKLGLPRFEEMMIGDHVPITVNPRYPGGGVPGEPRRLLILMIEYNAAAGVFFAFGTAIAELRIRRASHRSRS